MRDRVLSAILWGLFVLVALGLIYTQLLRFGYYSRLSKNNAIRIMPIDGPRGKIFDRNKILLVTNRLSFDVALIYQELRNREKLARLLNTTLGISGRNLIRYLEKASLKPYAPVTILEDIDKEKALTLEEETFDVDGLVVETRSRRHYIYDDVGSHIFGYLTEISETELGGLKDYGYRMKDLVGRSGLEKYYNTYLTGVDGGLQIEVDNKGRQTRILGLKEPSSGRDLYLTIDMELEKLCDVLLGEHSGAIIIMNPKNGEILALVSHPAFNPNSFVEPKSSEERLSLLRDKKRTPLVDRAITGLYAPGSVFKIVTASSALGTNRITRSTNFFCTGSYRLGNAKFDCWKEEGHGAQNITNGLMNSCNVFFYQTGRAAGVDNIEAFSKLFGFGKATGIDLPDESSGLVPGRAWKRLYKRENWYEGETLNYAIGQGYLLVTPIQVLQMMAVIANNGSVARPYIVKRIGSTEIANTRIKNISMRKDVIETIREGLFKVVNSENGTGKRAKVEGVLVAGKTGTAENPQGKTHAWFSGFAPYNDPKICLVVFLEHGGKGGLEPSEIAKGIFEEAKKRGYL